MRPLGLALLVAGLAERALALVEPEFRVVDLDIHNGLEVGPRGGCC